MMAQITILLLFLILSQSVFGIIQLRNFNKFVNNLKEKYRGHQGYYLSIERYKKALSSAIVLIVTDESKNVVEAYRYSGKSFFSRFIELKEVKNLNLMSENFKDKIKSYSTPVYKAILLILEKNSEEKYNEDKF